MAWVITMVVALPDIYLMTMTRVKAMIVILMIYYKNDEKWTIDVFNANSKLIYVLNLELRGDERLCPHHVRNVVLS